MKPVEPILVVELFPQERTQLLSLLSQLSQEEWAKPTACTGWSVKDVALHLFGGDVGLLSRTPDFKFPPLDIDISNWDNLVAFINHSNEIWVQATRRMGTDLLCKMLAFTGEEIHKRLASLDLFAPGVPVDWAGPGPAPIWLDVAREYTERWMHQQHIRDAVNRPGLKDKHFFGPVLDAFVRALPHTYRDVDAAPGTVLKFAISGPAGGQWFLVKESSQWGLYTGVASPPDTVVSMDQDVAWRVFTRGISKNEAAEQTTIEGTRALGVKIFDTVSIIA